MVVNARLVKPLDAELLCSLATKIKLLITVEEKALQGGFGSAALELFEEKGIRAVQVKRLGIPDTFVTHAPQDYLRHKYGIDAQGILTAAEALLKAPKSGFRLSKSRYLFPLIFSGSKLIW
jgi:1-deoxy-D-xylulose-5-phosphate synthase